MVAGGEEFNPEAKSFLEGMSELITKRGRGNWESDS